MFALPSPHYSAPLTSLPLHRLARQHHDNRLPNQLFTLLLQRKLRLPVLPTQLQSAQCSCSRTLDPYGDHIFTCTKASKTPLSNSVRDTLFTILRTIGPLSSLCHPLTDVLLEPPQWLHNFPGRRPADVGINLRPQSSTKAPLLYRRIAIDVTITTAQPSAPPAPNLPDPPLTHTLTKAHHKSAQDKFANGGTPVTAEINQAGIYLLPFTVDHLD